MKKLWISAVFIFCLCAGVVFAVHPVLKVGTDATYAPFETQDLNGKFVGFDMELMKMIADQMKVELQIKNVGWDGIIPGLNNGNYDCLISAMTITAERKKQIDFSTPYFTIKQGIVVKAENKTVTGPESLVGKIVAVQNGTTGDLYATNNIKDVHMKRFDANPQAIQELLNNNADAAIMDDLVALIAVKENKGKLKFVEIKNIEKEYYGIGIKKGNAKLLKQINAAIDTLTKNGKLAALVKKYRPEM